MQELIIQCTWLRCFHSITSLRNVAVYNSYVSLPIHSFQASVMLTKTKNCQEDYNPPVRSWARKTNILTTSV